MADAPLRIGILGAARIAPLALVRPAARVAGAEAFAVAARDPERARAFARKHGVPRVHARYDDLIDDPEVEAVYNPLPNALHARWSVRALEAGKHVLCEKPLAANAREARRMAGAAEKSGRVLVEAFHWRYHPLAERLRGVIASGELGRVRHLEAHLCFPLPVPGNIRFSLALAGGATMDAGGYPVSVLRFLAGDEPEVVRARAKLASPGVDRFMEADLRFPNGRTARLTCSLFSRSLLRSSARVEGDDGRMDVLNPYMPHAFHRVRVRSASGKRSFRVPGDATYTHQLRAFVAAVRDGVAVPTDAAHGVANMAVIDSIYAAAGLVPRGEQG